MNAEEPTSTSGPLHRGIAVALAAAVVAGLGYGLVDTAITASALFTG